jgi:hypothetical protein
MERKIRVGIACLISAMVLIAQQPVSQGPQASNAAAWLTSVSTWAGGTLGSMANYGTSPGAVLVPGVNAYITNSPTVSATFAASTTGGLLTPYHSSSAAAGSAKASAGALYGFVLGNSGTVDCWLQLFNTAGTPTAGTSVVDSIMVQAGVTVPLSPGPFALRNFTTGVGYAGATTDSGGTTTGCTTTFSVSLYVQ